MKKQIYFLVATIVYLHCNSCQSQEKSNRVILNNKPEISDINYYVYTPSKKIFIRYKSLEEVNNETIENILSSILSARNQEWVDFNTLGGEKNSRKVKKEMFEGITNIDSVEKKLTFLDLKSLFEFNANNSHWAITKFYVNSPQIRKPFSGFYLFQKIESRWYLTSTTWTSNLAIMLMSFDENKLASILNGQPTGNLLMDNLIKKVYKNKILDLNVLYKEYDDWHKEENNKWKDYFLDKNTWGY